MNETALATTSSRGKPRSLTTPPAPVPSAFGAHLARPSGQDLALAGIAHDACNLVTSLGLFADLMAEAGVLAPGQGHFADQMRGLADAAGHIFRRLSSVSRTALLASQTIAVETLVEDLSGAVRQLANLLSAVAGPSIEVQMACLPCAGALQLSEESLTRILFNLVRNAADAMPAGGHLRIAVQRGGGHSFFGTVPSFRADEFCADSDERWMQADGQQGCAAETVVLTVEDDGPGIAADLLDRVFEPGFSTRRDTRSWPHAQHHGLGLSIVRELVQAAGGTVRVTSSTPRGARFELGFPLTKVTVPVPSIPVLRSESQR